MSKMSKNLTNFLVFSILSILFLAVGAVLFLSFWGTIDDTGLTISGLILFIGMCFFWRAFYCLSWDIIEKKGYRENEIPHKIIVLINIMMGPFVFIYLIALPDQNLHNKTISFSSSNEINTSPSISEKEKFSKIQINSNTCSNCGYENSPAGKFCRQCGTQLAN